MSEQRPQLFHEAKDGFCAGGYGGGRGRNLAGVDAPLRQQQGDRRRSHAIRHREFSTEAETIHMEAALVFIQIKFVRVYISIAIRGKDFERPSYRHFRAPQNISVACKQRGLLERASVLHPALSYLLRLRLFHLGS